ncbi:MAG: putative Ig domain-containing protein, partial [Spirochaeta sp.]
QIRTLHIGGTGQSIASRTDERLLLHADNRTASGYITAVLQDGSSIQGPWIEIRQRGFALRGPEEIVLTAGSSIEVEYTLTGYADEIALRCDLAGGVDLAGASDPAGGADPTGGADPASSPDPSASSSPAGLVHASLSPDHAVPNAVINFRLQADQNAQPGSIPFTIRAESGGYSTALHGSIQLLPKMYMPRDQLPEGTVGRRYRTQIEVTGGSGTSRYETAGGRIPPGLQLHTDGTISGIPRESGRYMFEILVQDEQENELLQTVQMTVKSSEWSAHDMDSSRSRWNPVPVSGSPHLLWRSPAADLSGIRSMGSRIAVYGPSGLHVYDRDGGALLYHYPGAVEDMYAVDGIWLLQGENLQAVDAASGRLRWHRPSTRMLVLHNDELIAVGGNAGTTGPVPAAMRIHIGSGELIGYMAGSWNPDDAYLSAAGHSAEAYSIWSWGRHGLIRHNFDAVPFQTEITPYAAAIQDEHLYAVDSERLHIVTMDGEVIASRAHNRSMPVLIVHQHRIFLSDNDGTSTFAIEDLLPVDNVPYGSTAAIAASELLLIPGNHGTLAVHQLYHHVAWERTEPARAVMAAGGMVFILTGSEILAIDGESVPAPPTTEVQIYPAQPDGRNGYYRTEPRVRLRATDAVSTVAETRYRINEQRAYRQYQDEFVLRENGVVRLQYFSVDDEGYREVGRMLQIKIDTQAPKIDTRIHADSGRNGFFTGPVDIRFAVDPGSSGLDTAQLRVSCSDMYLPGETDTRQLRNSDVHRVTDDGIHYLQYEAADFAGNVTVEDHIIRIDSRVPEVYADVDMQPWSTRITLSAQAGPSGVARIEYRVNDSGVEHYADVLQLEIPGEYQIDTRAVSGAGIAGAWTTQTIQVQNWSPGSWIADLRFSTPRSGQEIIRNFTGETRLYAHHQTELLDNPPGQLTGADYIRTHSADRILSPQQELMSFRLLVDADVYILAYPDSRAEYPGFDEVFPGYHDARILKKTAPQGTRIHIPGSGSAERADLVFVQYRRDNDLVMYEPAVAEPLLSGGDLRLRAEFYQQEAGTGQNNDLIWLLQVAGEDQWRHIHTGQNGLAVLPQVARTTRAIVRVEQQNSRGKVVAFREREITIANHGRVVMEHPGPSGEVLAGELQALRFTAFDYRGEEVVPGRVAWKILARGHDNTAGSDEIVPLELDADSCFTVPSSPGLLRLYAELDIGQGIIHHEEFDFQAVEAFSPTVIPAEAVHSSGEEAASSYDAPGMSWQRDAEGRFRIYSGYGTFLVELAVVEEPDAVRKVNPRTHRRPMLLLHDAPRYPQFREGIWTLPVQDVDGVIQLQMPDWAQGFEVIIRRGGEE